MAREGSSRGSTPTRTRFAPSPSGDLHVGNVRTALYSWAWARHCGGSFVVRIEDTDRSRVSPEAVSGAIDALRWLGLDWDEGPDVGGEFGPYRQSERLSLYREWVDKFLADGTAYHCYCSQEELDGERDEQRTQGLPSGYAGHCRELTTAQVTAYRREGRRPLVRFRMPEGATVVRDTIRGEIVFDHANVPDFVVQRSDGYPLYNLAVSVDDAMMRITHIVRGDDLLASTPRQIAIHAAMGVAEADLPVYTHTPDILAADGLPLSSWRQAAGISWYRDHGYLPEAVVNYLALLGWSPGGDREELTLDALVESFDLERVGATAGRLDPRKLDAINGDKIRALPPDELVGRTMPFLARAGLVSEPPTPEQARTVAAAAPLIQERLVHLTEAADLLAFLLVPEYAFDVDPEAAARILTEDAKAVLEAAEAALRALPDWTDESIERALRRTLVDELGRRPKRAFGPVRVAVTGNRVSPPLFESLTLLGRARTLARIRRALDHHVGV
ncbi:glutamate--tRNA ligase [Actinopolymorpha rutila]|uniref:Glutamate--tRNA ligase n=1 Tax=Actinopolymorpha rutila TaxID=446787 RepID=A0A852Z8K2_9ACTN|nr:glutamate--tRNA ligase [Actinopolymorpha rutila]NYH89311.1 glutamyl-tRNA synthetase [Actinopolymorpha rutila]